MAITKIHPIKSTMNLAIAYICNRDKTDDKLLVSSYACAPETAHNEFELTRKNAVYNVNEKSNLGQHLIQSFAIGETSPEKAHAIGKMLADEVLKGKFEYVLTTHVDKGHVHNHIIFNSVDMEENKKYNSWAKSYYSIRDVSDRLCKENGLSIVTPEKNSRGKSFKKNYGNHSKQLRNKINYAIGKAKSYSEFIEVMAQIGYQSKQGKHLAFFGGEQERYIRVKGLGEKYTEEKIKERIESGKEQARPRKRYRYIANKDKLKSIAGHKAKAEIVAINKSTRYQREKQLRETVNTYNFLKKNGITSFSEMDSKLNDLENDISNTQTKITALNDRKNDVVRVLGITEKYFHCKKLLASKDTPENRKLFQSVRKQLMQMGFKDLPDLEALKIELDELNNGIKLFHKYAADKHRELSNISIAKDNLMIIKGIGGDASKPKEKEATESRQKDNSQLR